MKFKANIPFKSRMTVLEASYRPCQYFLTILPIACRDLVSGNSPFKY